MKDLLPDKYTLRARIYPAILGVLPIFILQHFFINEKVEDLVDFVLAIKIAGFAMIPTIILYFVVLTSRSVAKFFFENLYFKDQKHMPTTNYLWQW